MENKELEVEEFGMAAGATLSPSVNAGVKILRLESGFHISLLGRIF